LKKPPGGAVTRRRFYAHQPPVGRAPNNNTINKQAVVTLMSADELKPLAGRVTSHRHNVTMFTVDDRQLPNGTALVKRENPNLLRPIAEAKVFL
jgi:hypothetical protein